MEEEKSSNKDFHEKICVRGRRRLERVNAIEELTRKENEVQQQKQCKNIQSLESCPNYRRLLLPGPPSYLQKNGDEKEFREMARKRCN